MVPEIDELTIEGERFRRVAGFPSYWVSDRGRLVRANLVAGSPDKYGYRAVRLFLATGERWRIRLHRLVLEAFVGKAPAPDMEGAHGDGDRQNNRLDNLRWATPVENAADRERHGRTFRPTRRARGAQQGLAKLDEAIVRRMREERAAGASYAEIASRAEKRKKLYSSGTRLVLVLKTAIDAIRAAQEVERG